MTGERASKKQQELLQFVDVFIKSNGYGPSYREIMRSLGYKSVSTVAIHVDNLIAKGYIRRKDKSARSLEVISLSTPSSESQSSASWQNELFDHIDQQSLSDEQRDIVDAALSVLKISRDEKS